MGSAAVGLGVHGSVALILAEQVNYWGGILLFFPLVLLGGGSVVYWHLTEVWGHGDLRPYLLVQLYPWWQSR
jgi:hypothetical protein